MMERRRAGTPGGGMQAMKDWRSGAPMPSMDGITKLPGGGTQTVVGSPSFTLAKLQLGGGTPGGGS
jgi:hypothetical protein